MVTVWITVLIIGALSLGTSSQKIYSPWCSPVDTLFSFPGNCNKYLSCAPMGLVEMDCPSNLAFDVSRQRCDYPIYVPGCNDSVPFSPCNPAPCVNGTCILNPSKALGYECVCQKGYTGPSCVNDIDECSSNPGPCSRGVCINNYGGFACDCGNSGYTGTFCEIPPSLPCINRQPCVNGRCQLGTNSNYCICSSGYTGQLCDSAITGSCNSSPCSNGGRCVLTPTGGYYCNCTGTQFSGDKCETPETSTFCRDGICKHGRCDSTTTGFSCDCRGSGYKGIFCDIPVVDNSMCGPQTNPCVRGECVSVITGAFCDCKGTGYTGRFCDVPVNGGDACFPGACTNGVCVSTDGSYTCNCAGNVFTGPRCDITACNIDGENPCLNRGICVPQRDDNFTCTCPSGFSGTTCGILEIGRNCSTYQCPQTVPRYNYPDWTNSRCDSYYNCDRGSLSLRVCPAGDLFDVVSMQCKRSTDPVAVFCSRFL